jgi:iron complex transport system substrate-binding protein
LLLLTVAVVAACSGVANSGAAASPPYPVRLDTANGRVTIPQRPSRIISLSATATEDLYAVGAGKQVVAVDSYSTYPSQAPRTDLSGFTPNIEALAKYRPDLVLVSDDTKNLVAQLTKLQISVLVERPAADLSGVYAQIAEIAEATGHAAEAKQVVAGIQGQVQAIVRSVPLPGRPLTVYHELDQTYYSATTHTFIGQLYKLLHLQSIADRAPGSNDYPQLSAEYIISSDPDLVVLADTVCCGQNQAEWGPRIVLFLQAVAKAVKALEGPPR